MCITNTGEFISTTSNSIAVNALCLSIFNRTHIARCAPPVRARGFIRWRGFTKFDVLLDIFEFSQEIVRPGSPAFMSKRKVFTD